MHHSVTIRFMLLLRICFMLSLICGAYAVAAQQADAASCTKYNSSDTVLAGYGASFDPWDVTSSAILRTDCTSSNFSLYTGNENSTSLNFVAYKTGYRWTGSTWQAYSLTPDGGEWAGDYIRGKAKSSEALAYNTAAPTTYLVAFTCMKRDGEWKCGCRDSGCAASYWQLQGAVNPNAQINGGIPLAITKDGSGSGTVTSNIGGIACGNTCAANFQGQGNIVTLTATAASGSVFSGWGGVCAYRENASTCTVTMDTFKQVTATFQPADTAGGIIPLIVEKAGTGTGAVASTPSGISCGSTCTGLFPGSTELVTLTALPASGSVLAGWSITDVYGNQTSICGTALTCKVSPNGSTVTATFHSSGSSEISAPLLALNASYTLAWHDEFDGTTWTDKWVDREPWQSEPGYAGYGGGAWMRLPYGTLAEETDGKLVLRARKCSNPNNLEMCGAELSTRGKYQTFTHGYIEARVKNPAGADLFPALWLMGNGTGSTGQAWPRTGEIDIFEFVNNGHDTGIPFFTTHWYGSSCTEGHCQKTYTYPAAVPTYASQYHTWGLKRTSDVLEVYIDNELSSRLTRADLAAVGGNYDVIFNEPMHLRIDISAGGGWANNPSKAAEEGDLIFDYIRVWDKR